MKSIGCLICTESYVLKLTMFTLTSEPCLYICDKRYNIQHFFMHFCPGTMTTHAESINSDLQRGIDRRLRHTQH